MKKLIFMFICLFAGLAVQAQVIDSSVAFPKDSTTNTQTKYLTIATPVAIKGDYLASYFIIPVNKSGTETVNTMLQGSYDGTRWVDLGTSSDSVIVNTAGVVKALGYEIPNTIWRYYRVKCNGYNTGVTTFTGGFTLKRKQ